MKKTKRSKKSRSWVIKQHRDQFYKKSKTLGYRSRSAFKLLEINRKYKFIKNNSILLDIGSSPGGWSQVASEIIKEGKIISIDIKDMNKLDKVTFIKCDFLENEAKTKILDESGGKLDVVISDMAANTTGNKNLDCIRTNLLCAEVINFSFNMLKNKGILVAKIFMGEDFLEVKALAKKKFKKVEFFKPESSRNESKETYIHCSLLNTL
jgi:23S rRNA (uridine2552-2'-O)-methyltransferase|tara:strand:+ start:1638 stop:2264 length:627 start_codon:yes stop_codon:yes gene_type:complete